MKQLQKKTVWNALMGLSPFLTELYMTPGNRGQECCPDESHITLPQIRLMMLVAKFDPDGIRVGDIARILGLTPGATSKLVDRVVQEGLAERHTVPEDRRAAAVVLTDKARESWRHQLDWTNRFCMEVLSSRTDEEMRIFSEIINTLYGRICETLDTRKQEPKEEKI